MNEKGRKRKIRKKGKSVDSEVEGKIVERVELVESDDEGGKRGRGQERGDKRQATAKAPVSISGSSIPYETLSLSQLPETNIYISLL
jgi:hypothetical protein